MSETRVLVKSAAAGPKSHFAPAGQGFRFPIVQHKIGTLDLSGQKASDPWFRNSLPAGGRHLLRGRHRLPEGP